VTRTGEVGDAIDALDPLETDAVLFVLMRGGVRPAEPILVLREETNEVARKLSASMAA
jgi:hypothetical protein